MTVIISAYCDCNSGCFIVAIPYMWGIKEVVIIPIHPGNKVYVDKSKCKSCYYIYPGRDPGIFYICMLELFKFLLIL